MNRPICNTDGCERPCERIPPRESRKNKVYYKKFCSKCIVIKKAAAKGLTVQDYRRRLSRKTRKVKPFCENRDGRLGFICRCKIHHPTMLQLDHIDGNPSNNDPSNRQTLCANCHRYKTYVNKDHLSPGRKQLGVY